MPKKKNKETLQEKIKSKKAESPMGKSNQNLKHILLIFTICCSVVLADVLYTMATKTHLWSQHSALSASVASSLVKQTIPGKRGTIYDRNHLVLAQETPAYTIVAKFDNRSEEDKKQEAADQEKYDQQRLAAAQQDSPYEYDSVKAEIKKEQEDRNLMYVTDPAETAKKIKTVLGDYVDEENIKTTLENGLKKGLAQTELGLGTKRLDKTVKEKLEALKIPGISFIEATKRNYPSTPFSSNLLGFANYSEDSNDIAGVMGLEKTLDVSLSGEDGLVQYQQSRDGSPLPGTPTVLKESVPGEDVVLTLDSNLQQIVEQQMQITMDENNAKSAWCLVMEVETGRILAWASYPTYDQNTHLEIPSYTDNISEMMYEPGSVMKPFVYAAAIDAGVFPFNKEYRAGEFSYTVDPSSGTITRVENGTDTGNPGIKDALGTDFGVLTFEEGLAHSSNVAICELLANYLDKKTFDKYLDAFHFYQPTEIPYVPESTGKKNIDDATSYMSTGFGQASSLTILQLAQAYTALFNDGVMMEPYVVDSIIDNQTGEVVEKYEPTPVGTPISANTANEVKDIMHMVLEPGMSGERFAMEDVDLVAKTGTGEIYNPETGVYDRTNFTSSIMAAAPYNDPKIMVYWGMVSANYINYSPEPFQTIMQQALIANSVNGGTSSSQTSPYEKWESYSMPSLINHSTDYALKQMEGKKTNTVVIGDGSNVTDQFPKAGTVINSNDNVMILTDGDAIVMPDLIGWTRKDLTAFWQLTGISIQSDGYGKVTWQNIEPGTPLSPDMTIEVQLE